VSCDLLILYIYIFSFLLCPGQVEYARRNIEGVNRRAYDMLSSLVEWNTSAPCQPEDRAQKAEVRPAAGAVHRVELTRCTLYMSVM